MFKFLMEYIKQNKIKFLSFIIFGVLSRGISLYLPFLNGRLIDIIVEGVDRASLRNMINLIAMLAVSNLIISYLMSVALRHLATNIVQLINDKIIQHIRNLPLSFSHNFETGYLTKRIMVDSNTVSNFTLTSIKDFPLGIVSIVFSIAMLVYVNVLTGLMLIILVPIYIGLFLAFRKKMYKTNFLYKEAENYYFEEMNSQIENTKFIKINALKNMFNQSLWANFSVFFDKQMNYTKFSTLFSNIGAFIAVCANIIILIVGVNEIFDGNMTVGEFTIITTYFNMVIGTINYFLDFIKKYQSSLVSYNRLDEILQATEERKGTSKINDIKKIEFENVNFSYGANPLITDFSFKFEKGRVYRIHGENGKGKSTLMDLMIGLYNEYNGKIMVNDKDIKEINLYQMRKDLVAVVEQNLTIINGTISQNIGLDMEINQERLHYLSGTFGLNNFTERNNSNVKLSRKSNGLSGGEKQKLNIIRNLLKESKLLMLDEATSALDEASSIALKELINQEKKNKITIIIAHSDIFDDIVDAVIELR